MTKNVFFAPALLVLLFGAAPAGAVVLGMHDFETSTVDQLPLGPDQFFLVDTEPAGSPDGIPDRLFTAGAGGSVADPFGPAGNKSAVIHNRPAPPTQPQMIFSSDFSDDPTAFQNGKIEFDLYMATPTDSDGAEPQDEFWSYVNFRAGYGDATRNFIGGGGTDTSITVSFRQQLVLPDVIASGIFDDGNGFPGASNAVQPDTATHVEFNVIPPNPADAFPIGKFELRLDGTLISWGGDPLQTQQPFLTSGFPPAGSPGINMISFVAASEGISAVGAADVWIDNVKITQIPEPTSMALASVVFTAMLTMVRPGKGARKGYHC